MKKCLKQIARVALLVALSLSITSANAAFGWYRGTIKRIYMFPTGFVLTMDSTALDDCLYKYVYFQTPTLSEKTVDRALSIALTAQASNKTVGVVIDKAINGPGGKCNSTGSVEIKD